MKKRNIIWLLALLFMVLLHVSWAIATDGAERLNLDKDGLALKGYDAVSYHSGNPEVGKKEYSFMLDGATYLFASEEHLETFRANPEVYLPAYGGWCAWAMLDGEKVEIDPKTYKLINGRTNLFYNSFFVNTKSKWDDRAEAESEDALVKQADLQWDELSKKNLD
jgi:YHS domain-containing protein